MHKLSHIHSTKHKRKTNINKSRKSCVSNVGLKNGFLLQEHLQKRREAKFWKELFFIIEISKISYRGGGSRGEGGEEESRWKEREGRRNRCGDEGGEGTESSHNVALLKNDHSILFILNVLKESHQ